MVEISRQNSLGDRPHASFSFFSIEVLKQLCKAVEGGGRFGRLHSVGEKDGKTRFCRAGFSPGGHFARGIRSTAAKKKGRINRCLTRLFSRKSAAYPPRI